MITMGVGFFRFLYVLYIIVSTYAATTGYYNDDYKYFFLLLPIVYGIFFLLLKRGQFTIKTHILTQIGTVIITFIIVSVLAMFVNGMETHFEIDIVYMTLPLLLIFVVLNVDREPNKDFYMMGIAIGEIVYFVVANLPILFDINSYLSISFSKSYSPFELNTSQPLTAAFVYFYARKRYGMAALCFIFAFLSFKRLSVVFICFILLTGWFFRGKKVPNMLTNLTALAFIASPLLLDFLLSPEFTAWFDATFERSFQQFTMGRFTQISYVMNYDGVLLGRGVVHDMLSSPEHSVVSSYFHADLLRIYIETTIVGLTVFCFGYFNLVKQHKNFINYLHMCLIFATMFASVLLHGTSTIFATYLLCCVDFDALEKQKQTKKSLSRLPTRDMIKSKIRSHT